MTFPPPPKFEKKNQHVVPRRWQSRFSGENGRVWGLYRRNADPILSKHPERAGIPRQVSVADTMTDDWTYTIFDNWWRPSDTVEDLLADRERDMAAVFDDILDNSVTLSFGIVGRVCYALGLATCRTPENMKRARRRLEEFVYTVVDAAKYSNFAEYEADIQERFGLIIEESEYQYFRNLDLGTSLDIAGAIASTSEQHPEFNIQKYLFATAEELKNMIIGMEMQFIIADEPNFFVLGDTPLPDAEMSFGFSVPLSKSMALVAEPRKGSLTLPLRRVASIKEVMEINCDQYRRARDVVIGPSKEVLDTLETFCN